MSRHPDKTFTQQELKTTSSNIESLKPINLEDYPLINFTTMQEVEPKPIEYVLHPCVPIQGQAFIYAATGLGKTLFTMNIAYAIAAGGNFLKYSCPKPRKVLYIDAEMAFNQLHHRAMLIAKQQGDLDFPENLDFLTPDKIIPFQIPQIDTLQGQQFYVELIKKNNYEVVIFDNLSMLSCFDENKSHEWKPIQSWLLSLRAMGVTCFIVHHSGKDKISYRGTSRMLDAADVAISLQPMSDELFEDDSKEGKKFKIVYQKARIFNGRDALPFEATLYNGKWSHQSIENFITTRIIQCLEAKMTQRQIAQELFLSQSTVFRLIKEARKNGLIRD